MVGYKFNPLALWLITGKASFQEKVMKKCKKCGKTKCTCGK